MLVDRERELAAMSSETVLVSNKLSEVIEEKREMENVILQLQHEKSSVEIEKEDIEKNYEAVLAEVRSLHSKLQQLRCNSLFFSDGPIA